MRIVVLSLLLFAVACVPFAAAERIASSGDFIVDLDEAVPDDPTTPFTPRWNYLLNPDFESGVLDPWTTTAWYVTDEDAHAGTYCAEDYGNNWIRQDFDPIPVGDINSVTLWHKQPEVAISAIDFYYSPADYDEFLIWPSTPDWQFYDITGELRPTGMLYAIRIWGYSGGGGDPDLTRIDDISIDVAGTPVEGTTWGQIKALCR